MKRTFLLLILSLALCSICFATPKKNYIVKQQTNNTKQIVPNHTAKKRNRDQVDEVVGTSPDHEEWMINYILQEDEECPNKIMDKELKRILQE